MDFKKWYLSRGIWGSIIMAIGLLLQATGVASLSADEQKTLTDTLVTLASVLAEVVGFILAIVGRIKATKPIG